MVTCTTCGESKSESEYPTYKGRRCGRRCKACGSVYSAAHHADNRDYVAARVRARRQLAKVEAMAQYGGSCRTCGEVNLAFLCLDHVNDDGAAHRPSRGSSTLTGVLLYERLKIDGWPTDPPLQVLCHNHNIAKHVNLTQADGYAARSNRKLKIEAMIAYGGVCYCCKESDMAMLSLDHIDGDGGAKPRGGVAFYRKLRMSGWPNEPRLRTACMNCNLGREQHDGVCPHEMRVS